MDANNNTFFRNHFLSITLISCKKDIIRCQKTSQIILSQNIQTFHLGDTLKLNISLSDTTCFTVMSLREVTSFKPNVKVNGEKVFVDKLFRSNYTVVLDRNFVENHLAANPNLICITVEYEFLQQDTDNGFITLRDFVTLPLPQ